MAQWLCAENKGDAMISTEQRLARMNGIGSSDIPILAGLLTKYGKDADWLFRLKTGQIPEEPPTEAMEWGVIMEPIIFGKVAAQTGWIVQPDPETHKMTLQEWAYCHPDGKILAHPDRKGVGVLEIKNSRYYSVAKGPTDYQVCQLQWQLAVTGADFGVLAVLEAGQALHITMHEPDEQIAAKLYSMAQAFWRRVEVYREQQGGNQHDTSK